MNKPNRNRSLDFRDHQGLIHKYAVRYYPRLQAGKIIGVDFDDVMGELSLAFVKAAQGYNPDSEYTFTAYMGQCLQNHFNKYAARLMREQYGADASFNADDEHQFSGATSGVGYILLEDIAAVEEGDGDSLLERIESEDAGPEDVAHARSALAALWSDETLSPETRAYIGILIDPSRQISVAAKKHIQASFDSIKDEILVRYGIELRWDIWTQDDWKQSCIEGRAQKKRKAIQA